MSEPTLYDWSPTALTFSDGSVLPLPDSFEMCSNRDLVGNGLVVVACVRNGFRYGLLFRAGYSLARVCEGLSHAWGRARQRFPLLPDWTPTLV